MNIQALCTEYVVRHSRRFKKLKTVKDEQYIINKYVLPVLGKREIESIKRSDLEILHASMGDYPRQANKTLTLLSSIFNRAIEWERLTKNPVLGVRHYEERSREVYIPKNEGLILLQCFAELPDPYSGLFCFLLTTGCRKNEALGLKWEDLNLDTKTVTFRRTKNKKDHTLPLIPLAFDAVRRQAKTCEFVFSRFKKRIVDVRKPWAVITKKLGNKYWIHDLRRTLGSWLAQDGESLATIGAILNHNDPRSTMIYARFQVDHLKQPIQAALNSLDSLQQMD